MDSNYHQMNREITKGALWNQRMSDMQANTSYPVKHGTHGVVDYSYQNKKIYKSQYIAVIISTVIAITSIVGLVIYFCT